MQGVFHSCQLLEQVHREDAAMAQNRGYAMKLSTPIYNLKRRAKSLSRQEQIPLHAALDRIAQGEGFQNWSFLAARTASRSPTTEILELIAPGELVLLGARPGHGKTLMGLDIVAKSIDKGYHGWFFTLEWNKTDVEERLGFLGEENISSSDQFHFDGSDLISAGYIIDQLANAAIGTVAVVDYLQLLDQKRNTPDLSVQVNDLKNFARQKKVIIVCVSQIDRTYDSASKSIPDFSDVRLPNPLDLTLFDRACFLHNGSVNYAEVH